MKRALANATYGFRRLIPLISFHDLKVRLTGDHVSRGVWKRVFRGDYEKPEVDAVLALLQPEDRLLELGGGMGLVSGLVAKRFPKLKVETYEANPAMLGVIRELHALNDIRNVNVNGSILVNRDATGDREFYLHHSFAQSSMMRNKDDNQVSIKVPEKDIRQVFSEFRPQVMLCDIEGGEAELFDGLDLAVLRALVIELHPDRIDRLAEARIYDAAIKAGLYPRIELCSGTVVAFESIGTEKRDFLLTK